MVNAEAIQAAPTAMDQVPPGRRQLPPASRNYRRRDHELEVTDSRDSFRDGPAAGVIKDVLECVPLAGIVSKVLPSALMVRHPGRGRHSARRSSRGAFHSWFSLFQFANTSLLMCKPRR